MATLAVPGPALGALSALGCALLWTLLTLVARTLAPHFSSLSLNIVRSAVGGALLAGFALAAGDVSALRGVSAPTWAYLIVSVLTAVGVGDTAFFQSTRTLGLARAMTISTCYPLIASALAVWLVGEAVTPAGAAGTVITLGGLALIVRDDAAVTSAAPAGGGHGLALALLAALAWAVSAILMKPAVEDLDPITVQAVRLPLAAVLMWATPWARGTGRDLWRHRRAAGLRILALGAFTAASSVSFVAGLKYAGVAPATVLSSTSPLFALPIGLFFFGERVTWRAAAGAMLCVGGIALLSR